MHARDPWGGPLELTFPDQSPTSDTTDDTHSSWLLSHDREPKNMKNKNKEPVDLGCWLLNARILCWVIVGIVVAVVVAAAVVVRLRGGRERRVRVDVYGEVVGLGLRFFDAQRSGPLPKHNNISWRGNSGMKDGLSDSAVHLNLAGGFYDGGNAIKFNFPASFSMTMLSWSVIEYDAKYKHAGELDHVKEIIKWGADYFLKTFNSSANTIDSVIAQVGVGNVADKSPNDEYCWTRPEDIDYPRPVYKCYSCSDLAAEMTAALASAAIVFQDDLTYSKKLKHGAETLWKFARSRPGRYSEGANAAQFYNSTSYWDEFIWGGTWLYYATGNTTYISMVVSDYANVRDSNVFDAEPNYEIFGWDNKIGGAQLLLTRMRLFLNPGFPEEELLREVHNLTSVSMCSYLIDFTKYRRTKGGLIQLNHGGPKPLQYVANAAFLASLYADYLTATDTPGWYCGPYFYRTGVLREFAKFQIDYILGENPNKMSYVVGYGNRYPRYVHHRGASIPNNWEKYSCKGGWKWRDSKRPNPNTIIGAMVGGPDRKDGFRDVRTNRNYTEPTLAGNAGLVAASVSLSGNTNSIDTNSMFAFVTPMRFPGPPPPKKWNP